MAERAAGGPAPIKPWYRRWWVWLFIVAGVLLVIGVLIPAGDDDGNTTTTVAAARTTPTEGGSTATEAETTTTGTETTTTVKPSTSSATTTTMATTSTASTTTVAVPEPGIVLRADGLGVATFGDPPDEVIAALGELLGPPSGDEFDEPLFGSYHRIVRWDKQDLHVEFTDADFAQVLEAPVFGAWWAGINGKGLSTDAGVGPGTAYSQMAATYGDRLQLFAPDECNTSWAFALDLGDASRWSLFVLRGWLDGDPSVSTTRIGGMGSMGVGDLELADC